MRNNLFLLIGLVALYLLGSMALEMAYGPSYPFMEGEDCWLPDGQGGWRAHGHPSDPPPETPSVDVPIGLQYLPIFLPAALLVLFLFSPLRKRLESPPPDEDEIPPPPTQIP